MFTLYWQTGSKKLNLQNCSKPLSLEHVKIHRTSRDEWKNWLKTISLFFNGYKVASILHTKPINDKRPYVNIKIHDLTVSGLLDSGSAVTILGNNAHSALVSRGLELCTDDKLTIIAAGGQNLKSIGYINMPVHFENQFHIIQSHVVPEVQSSLILGIDFWHTFKICPKYLSSLHFPGPPLANLDVGSPTNFLRSYDYLDESQKAVVDNITKQFEEISFERKGLGRTNLITHHIDTGNSPPVRQRYYR
ncbi:retroviral-like aspartic protease, partial [Pseudomonas aeruginosa]